MTVMVRPRPGTKRRAPILIPRTRLENLKDSYYVYVRSTVRIFIQILFKFSQKFLSAIPLQDSNNIFPCGII